MLKTIRLRSLRHFLFYIRENRLQKLGLSNSIKPSISGVLTQGEVLTADVGNWSGYGDITFSYQWKRSGSNISAATNNTYTLVLADVGETISVAVTATHLNGSKVETSESTGVVS